MRPIRAAAAIVGFALAVAAFTPLAADPSRLPLFDAHVHYDRDAWSVHPPPDVMRRLREAGVTTIVASSQPNDGTLAVLDAAAGGMPRVVPFVRPYRDASDRATWMHDPSTVARLEADLARPIAWRGIGEFHVFGSDADTPTVRRISALALARGLWLHAHCDEAALVRLLAHAPDVRIIWAHTGFDTPPGRLAELMTRHDNLVGELSYRHDLARDGRLDPAWRELFLRFPDRFLVGSDTWSPSRWSRYAEIADGYREWLAYLPRDVAERIAYRNGERLFAGSR